MGGQDRTYYSLRLSY